MDVVGPPVKVILSVDPIRFPLTGIGRYTYELARGLQASPSVNVTFLQGYRLHQQLPQAEAQAPASRLLPLKKWAQQSVVVQELYRQIVPRIKQQAIRHLDDHVFHGPNYYLPPFQGRSVVTVHDLSVYLWPECHPPERVRFMRKEIWRSLQRATVLITDTEFTRQEVAHYFNWPLDRIHAVPLAASDVFHPRTVEELRPDLTTFDLHAGAYSLYTGTIEPRKNLIVLLNAYASLPQALRTRFPLVIAGYYGWQNTTIHDLIQKGQQQGWLRYLGYVPDAVLPNLMAGARIFAFPSLYEGFGLPVLEAMASGIPVLCSSASTLPEVAGTAAAFHEPNDVEQLTRLLQQGLEDESWRAAASTAGLAQANKFSWARCVQQTLDVYTTVEQT